MFQIYKKLCMDFTCKNPERSHDMDLIITSKNARQVLDFQLKEELVRIPIQGFGNLARKFLRIFRMRRASVFIGTK